MSAIDINILNHYKVILESENESEIVLGISNLALSEEISNELEFATGKKVRFVERGEQDVLNRLSKLESSLNQGETVKVFNNSNENVELLVQEALSLRSSDIHIEKYENEARIRLRIDGQLVKRYTIPDNIYSSIINKIKIRANLDIAEKRLPQDGRIHLSSDLASLDIRVSTTPSVYGEKIVMRLLNNNESFFGLNEIGFDTNQLEMFKRNISKPNGMVLISGPTGSGKTTTLYAALAQLNTVAKNITTIEDPVEYILDGINQVQLKEKIGFSYGSALRSFLRQDPDIIMIGEIRDADTANMVVRASLTGHLVLSTIHTNSAFGIIARLIDIGVQPFMLSETLNLVIAQRLIRKVCEHCKKEEVLSSDLQEKYGIERQSIGRGCSHCYHTGFSGRKAVYEMIEIDDELKSLIQSGDVNLNNYSKSNNHTSLKEAAIDLVKNGTTCLIEIESLLI